MKERHRKCRARIRNRKSQVNNGSSSRDALGTGGGVPCASCEWWKFAHQFCVRATRGDARQKSFFPLQMVKKFQRLRFKLSGKSVDLPEPDPRSNHPRNWIIPLGLQFLSSIDSSCSQCILYQDCFQIHPPKLGKNNCVASIKSTHRLIK